MVTKNKPINILLEVEVQTSKEREDFLEKFKNFKGRIIAFWISENNLNTPLQKL